MFKCCVCNGKSSKKEKPNGEVTKPSPKQSQRATDTQTVAADPAKVEENGPIGREEKLNGDVQRCQKDSLPPMENSPADVIDDLTVKSPLPAGKREEVNGDDSRLQKGSVEESNDKEDRVKANGDRMKADEGKEARELKDTSGNGEVADDGDENMSGSLDGGGGGGGVMEAILSSGVPGTVKTNLYDSSAYIERTIDDGPEEEGDDSVFEACPNDGNANKKASPGCEASDKEDHLEELVNRLENVTRRLEKVRTPSLSETQDSAVQTSTPSPKKAQKVQNSTAAQSVTPIESPHKRESDKFISMSVAGFEDLLAGPVREYLQLSGKIGGDVATHSKLVEKAFQIQLEFIRTAASRAAPSSQSEQVALLAPTSTQIQQIQEFREKNRGSPFFNHLSAISESIPALGWVAVSPTPAPYVKEMNDAGQFYTNRVLKDWKEKDKVHAEWCKAWVQTLSDLQQYVRQHHTTGLVWAKTGSAPAGIPPPPPPCMPIGDIAPANISDERSALFAEINQGEAITKNLKKVTSEMQTHKNPSLRTGPAPFKAPVVGNAVPGKTVPPASAPIDKPPVFTRDGKKWLVEYHKGNKNLLVENAEMNNVIYMFRCQDSTLVVKGKVNSIVMDSCRKSSVVFDSVVSSIEFVNCQSVQMQVLGKVPTISIDKTDGCQMYLSSDSLAVELISSKSSEMNVMVPQGNGDYTEYPVPEQFKTTVSPKGLSTIAIDSLG